jgi:small-conductance mechanosensitive channel
VVDWVAAGVAMAAALAAGPLLKRLMVRAIHRGDSERAAAEAVGRVVALFVVVAGLLFSLSLLGVHFGPLVGALGIGGVALAFAAQAILANFLGSIILQVRRPFRRGDQITTASCEGTVEEVNFRTVVLRTFDGERVLVPCAQVLGTPIVNHTTLGRRRTSVTVGVGPDTDLEMARQVLLTAVAGVEGVLTHPEPEVWVKEFGASTIEVVIRWWHPPDSATLWRVRSAVAVAVKAALDDAGIALPVPQHTVRLLPNEAGPGQAPDLRTWSFEERC